MEGVYDFIGSYIKKEVGASVCLCMWLHLHRGNRRGFVSVSEATEIVMLDSNLQALNAKSLSWLLWRMTYFKTPDKYYVEIASFRVFSHLLYLAVLCSVSFFSMQFWNWGEQQNKEKQVIWLMLGWCFNLEECCFTTASSLRSVWAAEEGSFAFYENRERGRM